MFRSIQHTITNRVIRDEVILYFVGIMIGIGGFAEATLAGMGMYVLVVFARPPLSHNLLVWSKDIAVVAIGLLLLVYWSYVDPHSLITSVQPAFCRINSNEGLSATESGFKCASSWPYLQKLQFSMLTALVTDFNNTAYQTTPSPA